MKKEIGPAKRSERHEEIAGEDELGVYPAKFHVLAVPERRYLVAAKKIMNVTLISVCLNAMLALGIFLWLKGTDSMNLSPRYLYWSDLTDSFEMFTPVPTAYNIRGHPCLEHPKFCTVVGNERYYVENFLREYHKARYTVSQDLADNAKRWCQDTVPASRSLEAVTKTNWPPAGMSEAYFGDFGERSCVVSRYSLRSEEYKTFKETQADLWQTMAAKEQFTRRVEVISVEPFYNSNILYVTTMKVMESKNGARLASEVFYWRTLTKVMLGGSKVGTEDGKEGVSPYFNSNIHLEDDNPSGARQAGIRIMSHAMLPDKSGVLRAFYEPLGY